MLGSGLRSISQRTQRRAVFSPNWELPIGGKTLSATGMKLIENRYLPILNKEYLSRLPLRL